MAQLMLVEPRGPRGRGKVEVVERKEEVATMGGKKIVSYKHNSLGLTCAKLRSVMETPCLTN